MLSKPSYGWTRVTLGPFNGPASDFTNVPNECAEAFIYSLKNDTPACITFDAEGWDFMVVSDYHESVVMVFKDEKPEIIKVGIGKYQLAKELLKDLENNLSDWASWYDEEDAENTEENHNTLYKNVYILKQEIENVKK
jgi:hypothetical protein